MKKRRMNIVLLVLCSILSAVNFLWDFRQGLSRADIFNYSCTALLLVLLLCAVLKSRKKQK